MKKTLLFLFLLIALQVSAIKNPAELRAIWKTAQPELLDATMNRVIATYPNTMDEVNVPVTWNKEGQYWKATFPIMGTPAYLIITDAGLVLHSERRLSQSFLPSNIKAAILELNPGWVQTGSFSSPVTDVFQIIDSPQGQQNVFMPGVVASYRITFDNGTTADMLKNTQAYKTITVNQYGTIQ